MSDEIVVNNNQVVDETYGAFIENVNPEQPNSVASKEINVEQFKVTS